VKEAPASGRHPILCINSGSSSLKIALYESDGRKEMLIAEGSVEPIGLKGGRLKLRNGAKETLADTPGKFPGHKAAIKAVFDALEKLRLPQPSGVGHRLVHGIRRYGFHGISYEYILDVLGERASGRLIIAHLGNGASMVAVRDGRPLDTTMGFSPTGGFMMGTRSGDLDPGILLYLMNEKSYDAEKIEHLVDHEAGLLGVSGISPDMKILLERRKHESSAAQAVYMFCYQLRKHVGALAAVLEGLDTFVFTGGIGEKAAPVRESVCAGLRHLGIVLDTGLNKASSDVISKPESPCTVRVMPTNEDLIIARHTYKLLIGK
jgi:acetate kinase